MVINFIEIALPLLTKLAVCPWTLCGILGCKVLFAACHLFYRLLRLSQLLFLVPQLIKGTVFSLFSSRRLKES